MTDPVALLEEMLETPAYHRLTASDEDALRAAIALMRAPVGDVSEADELRARLHKLADYWIGITRDQDIAFKDRPLLEMYDKGLTKCANELRHKLREVAK